MLNLPGLKRRLADGGYDIVHLHGDVDVQLPLTVVAEEAAAAD